MASLDQCIIPNDNYELIEVRDGDYMIQCKRTARRREGVEWFTDPLSNFSYPITEGIKYKGRWMLPETIEELIDKEK